MLLPVTAVSAGDFSFSSTASRPEATNNTVLVASVPQVTQDTSASSPAAVARALSGELQLQQGGTILAETIGKLLNIARMDGEAADAYVNRLVTTMQSLPAVQLASLEKQLGSFLKGMTVSILMEALKNASGPDAARLAALFEIARTQAGDGPKPALPSYLQDIQPEEPALIFRPAPTQQQPPPSNSPNAAALTGQQVEQAQGSTIAVRASPPAPPAEGGADRLYQQLPAPELQPNTSVQNITKPSALPILTEAARLPENLSLPAANPAGSAMSKLAGSVEPTQPAPVVALAKPLTIVQNTPLPVPEPEKASPIAGNLIAAGIPASAASAMMTAEQFHGASPQDMEKLLLAVFLGKLPQSPQTPSPASVWTSQLPQPGPAPHTEQTPKHNIAPASPKPPAPAGAHAAQPENQEVATASRQEMHLAARAATQADAKTAILDQPLLQSAVASLVTKEATPLPFVNYPIEKEEEESEAPHRGRWPSSESEAEGEQGQPDDQHAEGETQQEERIAANDETIDHSLSDGAHEDGSVGDAESYYLRMSNFA